jgi:hypothetical protein
VNKPLPKPVNFLIPSCLLILFIIGPIQGQTTIIAVRTKYQVVLAADSKLRNKSNSAPPFCKIRRCGNALLAVSGLYYVVTIYNEVVDVWPKLLETCSRDITPREQIARLQAAATAWLNARLEFAYKHSSTWMEYEGFRRRAHLEIVIIGWKVRPYIFGRVLENVEPRGLPASSVTAPIQYNYDTALKKNIFQDALFGHHENVPASETQRTQTYRKLGLEAGAEFFVNTMISSRPEDVGPPVDVVRITKGGTQWIKRKPECEEKKDPQAKPKSLPAKRRGRRK